MTMPLSLVWDLLARDMASAPILRVASAADKGAASMTRLSKTMVGANAKIAAAGGKLTKGVTVPLLGIGAVAVASAVKYQRAMTMVQTSTNTSAKEVSKASKALLDLAGKVAQSPEALSVSFYHAKSTGLSYAKALGVVKLATEGAAVGHTDLEATTNSLTAAVVSGIPGVKNFSQAMGALNAIVGQGDMKWSDLNEALSNGILKVGKEYGLSIRDVGAALADFGDNNIRGANAATQLRMAVMGLSVPAKAGSKLLGELGLSSEGSAKALAKIHLQTGTLAKDLQSGGLLKAVGDLRQHLVTSGVPLKAWGTALTQAFGKKAGVGIQIMVDDFGRLQQKFGLIGKQAGGFGKAFSETSKTAGFKADQLKAKFSALFIELGDKLIPVFTKLVDGITGAIHWFEGLSGTQKKILLWSAGVLAAVGPVLAIGAKFRLIGQGITSFVTGATARLASLGGASAATAQRMVGIARNFTRSLGGLGAGLLGSQFGGSGGKGFLTSILIGAAGGSAFGGIGALIGGVSAAIFKWTGLWDNTTSAAERAAEAQKRAIEKIQTAADGLKQSLIDDGNAIGALTRKAIASQLAGTKLKGGENVLQAASSLGLNTKAIVGAGVGNTADANKIKGQIQSERALLKAQESALAAAIQQRIQALHITGESINDVLKDARFKDFADQAKNIVGKEGLLQAVATALGITEQGTKAAIKANDAEALSVGKLSLKLRDVSTEVGVYGTALNGNSQAAKVNRAFILQHAAALDVQIAKHKLSTGAAQAELAQTLKQITGTDNLTDALRRVPKSVRSKLLADPHLAKGAIHDILQRLAALDRAKANPSIGARTAAANAALDAVIGKMRVIGQGVSSEVVINVRSPGGGTGRVTARAGGGGVPDGPFVVGERGAELGFKRGNKVDIISNSNSKRIIAATEMRVPGFASGTNTGAVIGSLKSFLNINNVKDVSTSYGQFQNLLSAVRSDHGSSALIARLKIEDRALNDAIRKRMVDAARLAKAQQILNDVATATKQGFDITTAGADDNGKVTFGGLRASQLQQKNIIQRWASGLRKIAKIFGKSAAGKAMLLQLAQAGPSSFPQVDALAHAGPSALKSIVATQNSINATAGSLGGFISSVETGGTIAQHKRQLRLDDRHDELLAARLGIDIRHALAGMTWRLGIDKRGIAKITLEGANLSARRT